MNTEGFLSAFRTRLFDVFRQEWHGRISNSSRASFYKEIVTEHSFNNIVDIVNVPAHRLAIMRLICSSLRLGIETGRWQKPKIPRDQRKCSICNKMDDEYHFILECTRFSESRKKFIKPYFWKRPSMMKCVSLLNTENRKQLRNLAKFIYVNISSGIQT